MKAAAQYPLIVLPGMELCTSEEIHGLPVRHPGKRPWPLTDMRRRPLPGCKEPAEIFGEQRIMDENDEITGYVEKLLINASSISVMEGWGRWWSPSAGWPYPAHIDKALIPSSPIWDFSRRSGSSPV